MNGIRDVFVCGHSDCKAMHALHSKSESSGEWAEDKLEGSPIKAWIARLVHYRVTLVVEYLGLVDMDLGCATILLGQ